MADDYERADDVGEDEEEEVEELELFPVCQRCHVGSLLPFSDHERDGAPLRYKAWVCSNPGCGFNLKIRRGDIVRDEPIHRGQPRLDPVRAPKLTLLRFDAWHREVAAAVARVWRA